MARVRSQKSISFVLTKAECVSMVGGCPDGLVRHIQTKMVGDECDVKIRPGNSMMFLVTRSLGNLLSVGWNYVTSTPAATIQKIKI